MRIVEQGIVNPAEAGTNRAVSKAPGLAVLGDGTIIASYRVGADSDTEDSTVELRRSSDGGRTWSDPTPLTPATVWGHRGSHYVGDVTDLGTGHLIVVSLWVDREVHPGQPLFNPETEGCLPMAILLADSTDNGRTWGSWRHVAMPEDVGPPSLTSPIFRLPDGRLVLSIETNKPYLDRTRWFQRVVYLYSPDEGRTWSAPHAVAADPTGRIFNWDQRAAVWPDGRIATFSWTFDHDANRYLDIHRRISADGGLTWSDPEPLGITDQAAHPAVLPDGRVVLAWIDRFGDESIKARLAAGIDSPFDPASEVVLYERPQTHGGPVTGDDAGEMLDEMARWSYGTPFGETLPDGTVLVLYYAGDPRALGIRWARIDPNG